MGQEIKGIVRPPMKMPAELLGQRSERAVTKIPKKRVPLLITLFVWYCFLRAAAFLVFALIEGLAPDSSAAVFLATHFDPAPVRLPAEAAFFILTILYGMIGWRWLMRDWRARWGAMFLSGATAASAVVDLLADRAAGNPGDLVPTAHQPSLAGIVFNVLVCCYLAFYPGMDEIFRETPWN
jgi:hypothetical protein